MLIPPVEASHKDLYENWLVHMHDNDTNPLIEGDSLVTQFGNRLYSKHRQNSRNHQYISTETFESNKNLDGHH